MRLFGEHPARIAVAIVDTSDGRPLVDVPDAPAGMTSIVMVGGSLTGRDSVATGVVLTSELRFEAATAWIFDYAAAWRESLGLPGIQPLPDWIHLALLRMLTDPDSALDTMRPISDEKPMSLDALFAHRVSEREADAALAEVRGPRDMGQAVEARAFTDESTRLLVFLRDIMGDRALANIVGATAAGMPMPEILLRLPVPMTTSELDIAFRAWSNAKLAVANGSGR